MAPKKILVLFAHPAFHKSRVNRALIAAIQNIEHVTFHDLYEEYPDFMIQVKREQELLLAHDVIVFHHPFYWYSSPAILKEWQDLVLQYGFAYGDGGKALQGKWAFNVITTGGPQEAYDPKGYNRFTIRELLRPFDQTAHLCGIKYLPPFAVHSSLRVAGTPKVETYSHQYRNLLNAIRDGKITYEQVATLPYLNDIEAIQ